MSSTPEGKGSNRQKRSTHNTLLGCMDATTTATLTVQLKYKTIAEKFEAIHENYKEKLISAQELIRTYGLGKKGNNPKVLMTTTTDINEEDKKETALAAITKEISKIQHTNKLLEDQMGQMMKNDTKTQWQWSTGSCPVCQGNHTYTNKKDQVTRASDRLSNCEVWRKLSENERADKLTSVKGCKNCTSWKHEYKDCQWKDVYKPCEVPDMNGEACGLKHSIWLHGSNNIQCNVVRTIQQAYNDPRTLLHIVKHVFPNGESTMLFMDNGSTGTFITHKLAQTLRLKRKNRTCWVETAGRDFEEMETCVYDLELNDIHGNIHTIELTGIEKITSNQVADVSAAYKIFPQLKRGSVDRHSGDVGILIGSNYTSLLPKGVEDNFCEGNLRAVKTLFGTGWVLGGSHPSITAYTNKPDRVAENNTGIWPKPTHRANNVRTNPPYKSMEVETKETLRSMERKMDGLETESNKMKETMENMKRKVDSLQAENNKIKEDMTKTSQEVHPLKTIIEELQKEMNTLSKEH